MKTKNGFSMVEILVVMGVMAIVGVVLVMIFANTLRGSNKSQVLAVIKQNGQSVMDNIDKTIRNADEIVCPRPALINNPSTKIVVVKNGVYSRFWMINENGSSNGYVVLDFPTPLPREATQEKMCDATDISMVSPQILTDTNTLTGVSVKSGTFSQSPVPGYKTAVTVKFELDNGIAVPVIIGSQIDPVAFQTTIGLR